MKYGWNTLTILENKLMLIFICEHFEKSFFHYLKFQSKSQSQRHLIQFNKTLKMYSTGSQNV